MFSFTEIKVTADTVYISDDDKPDTKSVTNAAEAVCFILNKQHPGFRIVYKDTQGVWTELLHKDGIFKGFTDHPGLPH